MKHYEIKKGNNGWTKAEVTDPMGRKDSYGCFYSRKEAETWAYAKVRYYYGAKVADAEFAK